MLTASVLKDRNGKIYKITYKEEMQAVKKAIQEYIQQAVTLLEKQ